VGKIIMIEVHDNTTVNLQNKNIQKKMVLGTLAGSAPLGLLIPPSIILIVMETIDILPKLKQLGFWNQAGIVYMRGSCE
jgi:hypothetical protein